MTKNANKTVATSNSVIDFIANLENEQQKQDSQKLVNMMAEVSGHKPVLWGSSIIGFDSYHYKYATGREGDAPKIGFSPRKGKISLYITGNATKYARELEEMGKHKVGKGCIYINRLSELDTKKLETIVQMAYKDGHYF